MWMLPIIDRVCTAAIRVYYRFETIGEDLPDDGPLLLVANHPNGIVDAISVVAAARRPVRFLAKKPLFDDPLIGWLIRGSGSIPVLRRQDFPDQTVDNSRMFEAAFDALAEGETMSLFPEGISHDEPSLTTLRTGAARIALGASARTDAPITIVPIGLNIRHKEQFRSRALALIGKPVEWDDLRGRDVEDHEAVRILTDRVDRALREVTINLEKWEDVRLVEYAEAIWSAEHGLEDDVRHEARIEVTRALEKLRTDDPASIQPVVESIEEFAKLMETLGLRPRNLDAEPSLSGAILWTIRKLSLLILSIPVLIAGHAVFFVPYLGVVAADRHMKVTRDVRSTIKFFAGLLLYLPWIATLVAVVWWVFGWAWGTVALVGLPMLAMSTQWFRERWGYALRSVRQYLTLRRSSLRKRLKARRAAIARDLETLRHDVFG